MKKIILLLSIWATCNTPMPAQPKPLAGRIFGMCAPPSGSIANFYKNRDIAWDSCANIYYMQRTDNSYYKIKFSTGETGATGSQGIQGLTGNTGLTGAPGQGATITVGTTNTGAPGTNATVTNSGTSTNAVFNFQIPQGLRGQDGSGVGGQFPGLLSPDFFGAKHSNQTISATDLPQYAGTGATTSSTYDFGALQLCLNQCDRKSIVLYGSYYLSQGLIKPSMFKCKIEGNNAIWITTNNNNFAILSTVMPTDFSSAEARCGAGANFVLEDLWIQGQSNQTGFLPYASSNNYLRNVCISQCNTAYNMHFCLQTVAINCTALSCTNGMFLNWGGFTNPSISRSPTCNWSKITDFHAVSCTNIGIGVYGAYGVTLWGTIIEGNGQINRGIDLDDVGNSGVKNFEVYGGHFEGQTIASGAGNAYIHLNTVIGGSRTVIQAVYMHSAGLFLNATGQNSPTVIIERVNWLVTVPSIINNGYTYQFNYCDAFPYPAAIVDKFSSAGILVTGCGGTNPIFNAQGCGSNHYNYNCQGK